jgi:curved DNA-binding protein
MNYYSILGVSKEATSDEIKKAYRSLAMKYHPDQGGDEEKFKQLNEAYSVLGDPQKRSTYDQPPNRNFQGFSNNNFYSMSDVDDVIFDFFKQHSAFKKRPEQTKNSDLMLKCRISLKDSYIGKTANVSYQLPNSTLETIEITIPPGVEHGQTLRITGKGDNRRKDLPRGDLILTIEVDRDPSFAREGNNLVTRAKINVFDAMIGTTVRLTNINDEQLDIVIRAGVKHGQRISCKGLGFKHPKFTNDVGDLIIILDVETPSVNMADTETIELIKSLSKKIYSKST